MSGQSLSITKIDILFIVNYSETTLNLRTKILKSF